MISPWKVPLKVNVSRNFLLAANVLLMSTKQNDTVSAALTEA